MDNERDVEHRKQHMDYLRLKDLWRILQTSKPIEEINTTDPHFDHVKPAVDHFAQDILAQAQERTSWLVANSSMDADEAAVYTLTWVVAHTFRLGQLCAQLPKPLLYEDMTPCTCFKVTDYDIAEFMKDI